MKRYLEVLIKKDLADKMVFVGGPRQVGKTTMALNMMPKGRQYLNWDVLEHREFILSQKFPTAKAVVFDEIHKFHNWRNYLKGFYDLSKSASFNGGRQNAASKGGRQSASSKGGRVAANFGVRGASKITAHQRILVTGSARLDYYRHSGDSLMGRYYHYRLHPLSVKELNLSTQKQIQDLLVLGGFPEAYLSASQQQAARWQRMHTSLVVNEEIAAIEQSLYLSQMQQMLLRLPSLVGSPLSINALREDLQLAHATVAKYLDIFERLYLIYRLKAFSSQRFRVVKKEQKHYHYNWAVVPSKGARFENLVAGHLLKWVHWQQDAKGEDIDLCYFRDQTGREVDFVVTCKGQPVQAIECKAGSPSLSPHLAYFKARYPQCECLQVHLEKLKPYTNAQGVQAVHWSHFLNQLV